MASSSSLGLVLFLNVVFFAMAGACGTTPCPIPSTPSGGGGQCPIDALKLAACASVLDGLITVGLGKYPKQPCECCTLLNGLLDLEAAACLCTALRANVLGAANLVVPINLSLLLNYCGKDAPKDFQCP